MNDLNNSISLTEKDVVIQVDDSFNPPENYITIHCVHHPFGKSLKQQIINNQEKAKQLDYMLPWLRENLTKEQLDLLSIISDPLSRRILTYLATDNTVHSKCPGDKK